MEALRDKVGGSENAHVFVFQIYLRRIDSEELQRLPGTEGAAFPTFSTDGEWIALTAGGALKKIPVAGGLPIELVNEAGPMAWTQGTIIYARGGALYQIPKGGGPATLLYDESEVRWLHAVPGTQRLLVTENSPRWNQISLSADGSRMGSVADDDIYLFDPLRGVRTRLTLEGSNDDSVISPDGQSSGRLDLDPGGQSRCLVHAFGNTVTFVGSATRVSSRREVAVDAGHLQDRATTRWPASRF